MTRVPVHRFLVRLPLALHERVAEAVANADPAIFAKEYPDEGTRKYFPTIGDFVDYLLSAHEANHIGQVAAWRRAMGLPSNAE